MTTCINPQLRTLTRARRKGNWTLGLLALGLVALLPGAVHAGANDDTGWIAEQLDGKSPLGESRQRALARSALASEDAAERPAGKAAGKRGRRIASLGSTGVASIARQPSLSGGVSWLASATCLNGQLRSVIADVAVNFGPVRVNSTCRSRGHNARVGGAPRSQHLSGNAVDFRVFSSSGAVNAYLRSHGSVGGIKHYGGGLFHIDTGTRRPM